VATTDIDDIVGPVKCASLFLKEINRVKVYWVNKVMTMPEILISMR